MLGFSGKDKVIDILNDSSEFIWEGIFDTKKEEVDCVLEDGVGDGVEIGVWVGIGVGVDVVSVKDQTALQSLHVPDASFAFILQYQVPSFKSSGLYEVEVL